MKSLPGLPLQGYLKTQAHVYRKHFEELVNKDLAIFEERRLQDLLLCRAQAASFSVQEADFGDVWEHRLVELLERRQGYLQQMSGLSGKLKANIYRLNGELSAENQDNDHFTKHFEEQLQAASSKQPSSFADVDDTLKAEHEKRSAMFRAREKATLQVTFCIIWSLVFIWVM